MPRLMTRDPTADGGYPFDSDLHQMTDDGGPPAPDPARWADPDWRDAPGERGTSADWDWTPITAAMPPEGVIVETLTADRLLRVKWEGRLWRLPGGAHVPCFTPEDWRPQAPAAGAGPPRSSRP